MIESQPKFSFVIITVRVDNPEDESIGNPFTTTWEHAIAQVDWLNKTHGSGKLHTLRCLG